jgi:DNA (cytosine-5)-methyltransferase 1
LPTPTFLEFFAGAGIVRSALAPSWRCVWANDVDASKERIYIANFGKKEFVREDIAKVTAASLPSAEMAWASFPCQDLSLAGWQRGMSAERSGTFWAFWRLMRDLYDAGRRPRLIVIENVSGLLYGDNFTGMCEALAALDLKFGAMVLDAKWFLPQSRPRVFLVAVDRRATCEGFVADMPAGPHNPKALVTAWRKLPESLKDRWLWWRFETSIQRRPRPVERLIDLNPIDVEWNRDTETKRLLGMMSDVNRGKVEEVIKSRKLRVGFLYKRMREGRQRAEVRFDGVAGCLRTPGGGSSRQTILVVEGKKTRSRLLSPREAARLMGLDDGFQLPGSYNEAYKAMGDGVARNVVAALNDQILMPLSVAIAGSRFTNNARNEEREDHSKYRAKYRARTESRAARWATPAP